MAEVRRTRRRSREEKERMLPHESLSGLGFSSSSEQTTDLWVGGSGRANKIKHFLLLPFYREVLGSGQGPKKARYPSCSCTKTDQTGGAIPVP